jgi:colanic acid/amylovoran biosynthesis glycosyltransferase
MIKIAIYKTGMLPPTQTFIPDQVNAMRDFEPCYVGLERVANGHQFESEPIVLMKQRSTMSRLGKVAFKTAGFAPEFLKSVAESQPQLLHAHFVLDGVHALPIVSRLQVPFIVTLHAHAPTSFGKALPRTSLDNMVYSLRLPTLWKRASLFICVSEFVRKRALELGYPAEKLRVHYIGVDRRLFKPSTQPRDPRLVLFVGRLEERKGCNYLLEAMAEVKSVVPDARLVFIGGGSKRAELEQMSRDLNVDAEFLGRVSDEEKREWLSRARVFAGPSITAPDGDAEALGMVFAEAQATGLPVVSCYHGGVPEVVLDGKTGLLAAEHDSHGLAKHILRLIQDDVFWQSCSTRAMSWMEERFDLVKQTQELEQIYFSLLRSATV